MEESVKLDMNLEAKEIVTFIFDKQLVPNTAIFIWKPFVVTRQHRKCV